MPTPTPGSQAAKHRQALHDRFRRRCPGRCPWWSAGSAEAGRPIRLRRLRVGDDVAWAAEAGVHGLAGAVDDRLDAAGAVEEHGQDVVEPDAGGIRRLEGHGVLDGHPLIEIGVAAHAIAGERGHAGRDVEGRVTSWVALDIQTGWLGTSYGFSFWKNRSVPPWPFQIVSYCWKCSTARPLAVTLFPLTASPVAEGSPDQVPAPAPWSARQTQTSSMIELLLLSTKAVAAEPASAPPTRKNTSSMLSGFEALFAVDPSTPTCSRAEDWVGPASKMRPEMLTPGTPATFIVMLPAVGISVAKPRPTILVFGLVTLIVWLYW